MPDYLPAVCLICNVFMLHIKKLLKIPSEWSKYLLKHANLSRILILSYIRISFVKIAAVLLNTPLQSLQWIFRNDFNTIEFKQIKVGYILHS